LPARSPAAVAAGAISPIISTRSACGVAWRAARSPSGNRSTTLLSLASTSPLADKRSIAPSSASMRAIRPPS
jgi:hypothetical protein